MQTHSAAHRSPRCISPKGLLFRFAAVLLGISPLLLAEIGLRAFDLGRLNEIEDPYVGFSSVRPLFELNSARQRYEIAPSRLALFYPDSFAAQKGKNEFRVFCLGGSTVQGSPYTIETAFATWLELSLRSADPSRNWKVVNCGGLSYASYRLVPILSEVLAHKADLIIIYTGQNEFLEDRSYRDVKRIPPLVARAHAACSGWRCYNLCRLAWIHLCRRISPPAGSRTIMPAEVDAWLDHPGGLNAYHRNDDWRHGVIDHYGRNLQRMADSCRQAGVPLVFCNPVCNLKDCPPFKTEPSGELSGENRIRLDQMWNEARSLTNDQLARRVQLVRGVLALDDRYAAAHFLLGHGYLAEGRIAEARDEFVRAKDEDICPLRMLEPMYAALAQVASRNKVPLVDIRALIEDRTPDHIPGQEWLLDHVHPTISGHQLIAESLFHQMEHMGLVHTRPGWQQQRDVAFREHLAQLDTPYFLRAKERLDGQRKWTEGRAFKQHPSSR
jgi:lysophospholipase L1-like esterase